MRPNTIVVGFFQEDVPEDQIMENVAQKAHAVSLGTEKQRVNVQSCQPQVVLCGEVRGTWRSSETIRTWTTESRSWEVQISPEAETVCTSGVRGGESG